MGFLDRPFNVTAVTIASGATTSGDLVLFADSLLAIQIPSAFTGTTMTFTGSLDGANFIALYNSNGTALSITVSTSRIILLSPGDFIGLNAIRLVSGSTEGGTRTILCLTRRFS